MNITVEYTAPMKCSFLVHGGSYGHLEIIVSIKQPNCRTNIIMLISEIKVLEFMDILAEAICFSDQNSLKILMPFAKFSGVHLLWIRPNILIGLQKLPLRPIT
jgi:hypothetical protein